MKLLVVIDILICLSIEWEGVKTEHAKRTTDCLVLAPGEEQFITSPNYPSVYGNNEDFAACVQAGTNGLLYYEVVTFETECDHDFLTINGNRQPCDEISSICGIEVPSNNLEITFKTDGTITYSGFSIKVWATEQDTVSSDSCAVLTPGEERMITSPNYPSNYDTCVNMFTCVKLEGDANVRLYYRVTDFETECGYDFLTINGNRQPCDETSPNCGIDVLSKTLEITFMTDGTSTYRGFSIKVWAAEQETAIASDSCVVLTLGEEQILTSPNYPSNYDNCGNMFTCVKTEGNTILDYEVTDFETQCDVDNLVINGNTHTCNEISPSAVPVPSRNLEVTFHTDGQIVNRGFRMRVWASDLCIHLAPGEEQIITSPNYPSNYDNQEEMNACVVVDGDAILHYQVTAFQTECNYDFLTINGNRQPCNEISSSDGVEVTSNNLDVTFTSDNSVVNPGFSMRVWAAEPVATTEQSDSCEVLTSNEETTIASPNYPSNYENGANKAACVTLEGDAKLYYQVTDFDIECGYDILTINGNIQSCNEVSTSGHEVPSKNLEITFTSDQSVTYNGFSIRVWAAVTVPTTTPPSVSCEVIPPDEERILTSPNFPSDYDNDVHMAACFGATEGVSMYYQLTDYETECNVDVLTINGNQQSCNKITTGDGTEVPDNDLQVTFTSDGSVVYRGFRMRIWVPHIPVPPSDCDKYVELTSGEAQIVKSGNYPSPYDPFESSTVCFGAWGNAILLYEMTDFDVECGYDNVTVNGDIQACDTISVGETIAVTSTYLKISFESDCQVEKRGFNLRVWAEAE